MLQAWSREDGTGRHRYARLIDFHSSCIYLEKRATLALRIDLGMSYHLMFSMMCSATWVSTTLIITLSTSPQLEAGMA
jgi:hypothetical protein